MSTLTLRQELAWLGRLERGWKRALRPLQRTRPSRQYKPRRTLRNKPAPQPRPQPSLAIRRLRLRMQLQAEQQYNRLLTQAWEQAQWHPIPPLPRP